MTVAVRTPKAAFWTVAATLILGLLVPNAAEGKPKKTREAFVPVGEVPDGLAVVYVFRRHRDGKWLMSVHAGGRLAGALSEYSPKGTYLPILVPPGELTLDSTVTATGFEKNIRGVHRVPGVTINVEAGRQYYVVKRKWGGVELQIAEPEAVEKHLLHSVMAEMPPGFLGYYHYYEADVFMDLAARKDEAGQREAAEEALRRAVEHYTSASSGFREPIPKPKKWKAYFKEVGIAFAPVILEMQATQVANEIEAAAAVAGGSSWSSVQRRALIDAYVHVNSFENPGGRPTVQPKFAPGDLVGLANRMDELVKMADAAHACYVGNDVPSLEQCASLPDTQQKSTP